MLMLKANAVIGRRRQAGRLLMNRGVNHRLYGRNRLWLYGCHLFNVVGDQGGTGVHQNRRHLQWRLGSVTVMRGIILYGDLIVASDIDFHGRRAMDAAAK